VLPQQSIEAALDRILMVGGKHRLNQLRDQAREIATELGYEEQFTRLDSLVGALLGTQEATYLTAKQALARAAGRPYGPVRLQIFDALFSILNAAPLPDIPDPAPSGTARENFAFFEAYFSNYIEGTTFTVEEAEEIVFHVHVSGRRADRKTSVMTVSASPMPRCKWTAQTSSVCWIAVSQYCQRSMLGSPNGWPRFRRWGVR